MAKHDEAEIAIYTMKGLLALIRLAADQLDAQYVSKPATRKLNIVKMKQGKRRHG